MNLKVTAMQKEDMMAVVALEHQCQLSSRGEEGYLKLFQDENWLLLVAKQSSQLVGIFTGLMIIDELQIDNIAVAESWRQKGIATELLETALKTAQEKGMMTAILEVRASNFPAYRLYERHGFTIAGRRKSYYQTPPDDALLMLLKIGKQA